MVNLERLELSRNSIDEYSNKYLKKLYNLRTLDISHNEFSNINDLFDLDQLETFLSSDNEIATVDMSKISSLNNLRTLDLSNNQLTDLFGMSPRIHPLTIRIQGNIIRKNPLKYPNIDFDPPISGDSLGRPEELINKGKIKNLQSQNFAQKVKTFEDYFYAMLGATSECNEENFTYLRSQFKGSKISLYRHKSSTGMTPLLALVEASLKNETEIKRCVYIALRILQHGRGFLVNDRAKDLSALDLAVIRKSIPLIKVFLSASPSVDTLNSAIFHSKKIGRAHV